MKDGLRRYGLMLLAGTQQYSSDIDAYKSIEAVDFCSLKLSDKAGTFFSESDNGGQEYVIISSWDNARWFVPNKKKVISHIGNLIKPSSIKSRLAWEIAKLFNRFGCIDRVFRTKVYIKTTCLGNFFLDNEDENIDYVIYTGSRGVWQKFTIQEMKNNEILSFTKVGKHDLAKQRIINETRILELLNEQKDIHPFVPQIIRSYERNGMQFLKQTSCPFYYNQIISVFGDQHKSFLERLNRLSKKVDANDYLAKLQERIEGIGREDEESKIINSILLEGYSLLCRDLKGSILLCLSHGDFSQWNCFSNGKDVFVFDWEMGAYRFPLWDYFNFIFHKNLLIDKEDKYKLKHDLNTNKQWAESVLPQNYLKAQLVYLMDIIIEYCYQNNVTKAYDLETNGLQLSRYFVDALKYFIDNEYKHC